MNKNNFIFLLISGLVFTCSCKSDVNVKENINGKWSMNNVKEVSEDVTQRHNPNNDRWIKFIDNAEIENGGTFESGSGDTKENSGKWFYNEKENELYLDSDAGEDDDSYWSVTIEGNTMLWKGRKFEFNKRFEIEYTKLE